MEAGSLHRSRTSDWEAAGVGARHVSGTADYSRRSPRRVRFPLWCMAATAPGDTTRGHRLLPVISDRIDRIARETAVSREGPVRPDSVPLDRIGSYGASSA